MSPTGPGASPPIAVSEAVPRPAQPVGRTRLSRPAASESLASSGGAPRKLSPPLHGRTIGQQPLGDVPADAAAPLDRLRAVPELAALRQHRLATLPPRAEPALRRDLPPAAGHLDRAWPGTGREPGQQPADERTSAPPRA